MFFFILLLEIVDYLMFLDELGLILIVVKFMVVIVILGSGVLLLIFFMDLFSLFKNF